MRSQYPNFKCSKILYTRFHTCFLRSQFQMGLDPVDMPWVRCGPSGLARISTAPVGQQKMHRFSDFLHTGYPTAPRLSDAGQYGLAGVGQQLTCIIPVLYYTGIHGPHPGMGYMQANPACNPCIVLVTGITCWPVLHLTNHG